jgi:hypothetical protein
MNGRPVRWLIGAATAGASLLGSVSAQPAATVPRNEASLLNAAIELRCAENMANTVTPAGYLLALHPDGIRDEPSDPSGAAAQPSDHVLRANIVVFVSVSGAFMPLVLRQYEATGMFVYLVNCQGQPTPGAQPNDFPGLRIRLENGDDKVAVTAALKSSSATAADRLTPSMLFSGERPEAALVRWPRTGQPVTYHGLIAGYLEDRRELAFLGGAQGGFSVESLEGDPKVVDLKKIVSRAQTRPDGRDDERPNTSAAGGIGLVGEPPAQKHRRRVQIRLASKSLHAFDLSAPSVVDTFGYCNGVKREGATAGSGAFTLEDCITDDRRQIPLRLRGFESTALEVGTQPVRIDSLLKVVPYSVPYPPEWQGAAADRVEVQGGAIEQVLRRRVTLRQFGLPQCEAGVTLTPADVVAGTLSFPEPPCTTVDVQLPKEMFGKAAPFAEGCRPGSVVPAHAFSDGRLRCVVTRAEAKAPSKRIRIVWAAGFEPFELEISTASGARLQFMVGELAKHLRASLPRAEAVPSDSNMPAYRVREAQYFVGAQPCAKLRLEKNLVPSMGDAGCRALPDRLELSFEVDREKSDPAIPTEAFKDTIVQSVALGVAGAAVRPPDASRARLNLPVDFNPERRQRYASQYTKPAELVVPGARVYALPGCSERDSSAKVRLFTRSDKAADFQWPAYAQVFDNDGRPLTSCEKSQIERGEDGRPYLTFQFTSIRAAGARRAIILARGQDLMDRPGMPKALEAAFSRFVDTAHGWHKQGAPLSPVDLLSVNQDGALRRVLSAEEAALQPQAAAQSLARIDRIAPKTLDLSLLRLQPETKGAERVIIIMDGSIATPRQVSELRLLGSDLAARKGGSLQFLLSTDSCVLWQPHAPQLKCVDIGGLRSADREKILVEAFISMLEPLGAR